ncbi:neural cell adhesion molecule 1 [Protopterus annectens]|uniref:neural cell adhesion molecule 1 n=1 Tax=Protopterus annectens TaxID=7888 RepID=UPI001CFB09DE|nr:neural cell adhesion molecule 1 [Protopterus annectens]
MTSYDEEFTKECDFVMDMFRERGYPDILIHETIQVVVLGRKGRFAPILGQDHLVLSDTVVNDNTLSNWEQAYIMDYTGGSGVIKQIVKREWDRFRQISDLDLVHSQPLKFTYRKDLNFKQLFECGGGPKVGVAGYVKKQVYFTCLHYVLSTNLLGGFYVDSARVQSLSAQHLFQLGIYSRSNHRLFFFFLALAALQVNITPVQGEFSVDESKFFECHVTGEPQDISWYSPSGEKIAPNQPRLSVLRNDETSSLSTLTIYSAKIDDAGIYKCVASAADGTEYEATVSVKIFQKLTFKEAPSPQEFKEGDDAVIICDVISSPPPSVFWKHKGKDIILKKDARFVVLSNNFLQIQNVKKTDEGIYRCEGRVLARGEISFRDIAISVNVPPSIRARVTDVNVTADLANSVTLACDAEGYPEPQVYWTKDDDEIEAKDNKYSFNSEKNEMTVHNIGKEDDGEYSCFAENKAGDAEAKITVKVFVKPSITYVENKTAMELDDQITLTCEASGDPTPSITWRTATRVFKEGDQQASWTRPEKYETLDGRIAVRGHARVSSVTLKDVQYTDSGEYICTATNPVGHDSKSMFLEVEYTPKILGSVAVYTWEGNTVNITCQVFAFPKASISWFRDGEPLPSKNYSNVKLYNTPTASYLEVTPDSENDFGTYNCSATNRVGQESKEFILVQADTPSAPIINNVTPYSSSAKLEFEEPEATGGVPILKYLAEWKVPGADSWSVLKYDARDVSYDNAITVSGLKPETTYKIRLSAINGKGQGETSNLVDFKTEPVPTESPTKFETTELSKGEPSAPKVDGQVQDHGNIFRVNWIKQDDGGSPIKHFLVRYKARNASEWKPEMKIPAESDYAILSGLDWSAEYEVYVMAENHQGKSQPGFLVFRTASEPTAIPADTDAGAGLGVGAIAGILIVIFVLLLVIVDVTCYFLNKCGLLMCIAVNLCGKSGPGAKGKDIEEGKAAFSKDESKEPIVEVRTEEERTPNHDGGIQTEPNETTPLTEPEHPSDTTATVEDALPSATTVTTNSEAVTETFATAQNSPTSETTTLSSSIAPAAHESNSIPAPQVSSPKAAAAVSAPSKQAASASETAAKDGPLVDLSDTPATTYSPASNVLTGLSQSPTTAATATEASKAPVNSKPAATTQPASDPKQTKRDEPSTKSPEKETEKPTAAKSQTEAVKNPASPKTEAASDSSTNPSQGEDFQMDGGTFKTSDIDLAKDVFAALGTTAPASVASGQAAEPASSATDVTVSPAPAKNEKTQIEENSKPEEKPKAEENCKPEESETKTLPAEVKTVPNEATQKNENESKA